MPNIVQIPLMNPLKFVELDAATVARYESKHIDREWFRLVQKSWERKVSYDQPWRLDDPICIHIHTSGTPTLRLVNEYGFEVGGGGTGFPQTTTLPGNVVGGTTLATHQITTNGAAFSATSGRHYFVITHTNSGITRQFISEPIRFKESWPDTLLIEYQHNRNEHHTVFSLNPKFAHRVEADLKDWTNEYDDTAFRDQGGRRSLIHSTRADLWTLRIGSKKGVPSWVTKRIAEALQCSVVMVDGLRYVRDQGETFDIARRTPTPLETATITLYDQDPEGKITWGAGTVTLFTVPSYPFALGVAQMDGGGMPTAFLSDAQVIEDATGLTAYITALNALGLDGGFSVIAGQLVYANGTSESFNSATVNVYTKALTVGVEVSTPGDALKYFYAGLGGHITDWGNGIVSEYGPSLVPVSSGGMPYNSAGTKTLRLFHNDDLAVLRWNDPGVAVATATAFSGEVPAQLYEWRATGPGLSSGYTFDLDLLLPCRNALGIFAMNGMGLSTLTGTVFEQAYSLDPLSVFPGLGYCSVNNNFLDTASLSVLTEDFLEYGTGLSNGGTWDVENQIPPAVPTGTLLDALDELEMTYGWAVYHDA